MSVQFSSVRLRRSVCAFTPPLYNKRRRWAVICIGLLDSVVYGTSTQACRIFPDTARLLHNRLLRTTFIVLVFQWWIQKNCVGRAPRPRRWSWLITMVRTQTIEIRRFFQFDKNVETFILKCSEMSFWWLKLQKTASFPGPPPQHPAKGVYSAPRNRTGSPGQEF